MKVNSIKLNNFRNISSVILEANNGVNVIYGENAQGKTNILEGIWLFTGCKSFRGSKDAELIRFGEVQGALRFGDDFVDLSRWNFSVEVDGGFYYNRARSASDEKFNQSQFSVKAAVGRMLGQHQLKIHAGYMGVYGGGALEAYKNNILMAGARYGVSGNRFNFLIGADYYHDRVPKVFGHTQDIVVNIGLNLKKYPIY